MKKFWSLLLCLLLIFSFTVSLCACEKGNAPTNGDSQPSEPSEPENLLLGNWLWSLDVSGKFNSSVNNLDLGMLAIDSFDYRVILELNEDGTAKLYIQEDYAFTEYHWIASLFEQGLTSVIPDVFHMSLEEYLQSKNTTLSDLVESVMAPLHPNNLGISMTGYYKVEGNKLYLSEDTDFTEEEADVFTLNGDELIIENEGSAPFAPMCFDRITGMQED